MKMTKQEILEREAELNQVLKLDYELDFKIVYAVRRTKNKLTKYASEIKEVISDSRKCEQQLDLKYCSRDDGGKPVITRIFQMDNKNNPVLVSENYSGLEIGNNLEYDKAKEELINARSSLLKEVVDIEIFTFSEELIPKKGPSNILSAICFLIEDAQKKE